jgi:hypothetical protein
VYFRSGNTSGWSGANNPNQQYTTATDAAVRWPTGTARVVRQTVDPPTVVTRYVDTASTGGDGTTAALSGASAAFASLNAALTAMQATNWASLNQQPRVLCAASTGLADTTTAAFSATWIGMTSPTCYVEVIGDQPNALQYDATKYRIEVVTTGAIHCFSATGIHLRMSRIAAKSTIAAGAVSISIINLSATGDLRLDRLHVVGVVDNGRTSACQAFRLAATAAGQMRVSNSLARGMTGTGATHVGFLADTATGPVFLYDCASVDNAVGYSGAATVALKNCGATGGTTTYSGTFNTTDSTNNASSTATSPPGASARTSVTPTFVDAAGGDYHLASGDTAWKDQGADLSADVFFPVTADGDGTTRSAPWDIGADEYVSALTNYTLALGAGSYALTGATAATPRGYKTAANAGAYAYTGGTATTRKGYALAAVAGSYALTGGAATFRRTYVVPANAGSYTLTGGTATVRATRLAAAGAGSYALAGTTAGMAKGVALAASAGSYAVTGSTATIRVARTLAATSGAYALTGGGATLAYTDITAYELQAGSGVYTVTGVAATARTTRVATLNAGAYAVSGAGADLRTARVLAAGAGSYAYTGEDIDPRKGYRMEAESGAYASAGADATLVAVQQAVLAADSGVYVLGGADATLIQRFLAGGGMTTPPRGGGAGVVVVERDRRVSDHQREQDLEDQIAALESALARERARASAAIGEAVREMGGRQAPAAPAINVPPIDSPLIAGAATTEGVTVAAPAPGAPDAILAPVVAIVEGAALAATPEAAGAVQPSAPVFAAGEPAVQAAPVAATPAPAVTYSPHDITALILALTEALLV